MQTTETYLGLLRECGKKGLPIQRVYRQLFNCHLYLTVYGKLYRNAGAMIRGITRETVDAMLVERIRRSSCPSYRKASMETSKTHLHFEAEQEKKAIGYAIVIPFGQITWFIIASNT